MRLTRASVYALRALAHLARLREGEGPPLASYTLARTQGLPEEFLIKPLRQLVAAGVLRSRKGHHGGYRLARPPATITLLEVVEVVGGPVFGAAPPTGKGEAGRALDAHLREVCDHLAGLTRRCLGEVRLSDLAAD
jgi:Rrf2 family protein